MNYYGKVRIRSWNIMTLIRPNVNLYTREKIWEFLQSDIWQQVKVPVLISLRGRISVRVIHEEL